MRGRGIMNSIYTRIGDMSAAHDCRVSSRGVESEEVGSSRETSYSTKPSLSVNGGLEGVVDASRVGCRCGGVMCLEPSTTRYGSSLL